MSRAVGFFKNIILTNKGKELLLSSNNNIDNSIDFTICKFGDGRYTEDEIPTAIDIKNAWKTQNINTVRIDNSESNPKLIIEITFSNKDMQEPKILNELGIFARDKQGSTHLFAYSLSNVLEGEEIEIENDYPTTFKISIISKISNKTNITNIIDPDGFLTKEVIELLKLHISNIAIQRLKGTLRAGQQVIELNHDGSLISNLSNRLQLFIGGELYSLDNDYTIDISNNTITLNNFYNFKDGTIYEIIDPLPPTYVKELLDDFFRKADEKLEEVNTTLDITKNSIIEAVNSVKNELIEALNDKNIEIIHNLDLKIEDFYNELNTFIENNKEELKGKSAYEVWLDTGNIGTVEDFINSLKVKGDTGVGVSNVELLEIDENGNRNYSLVLTDGSRTPGFFTTEKGDTGEPFSFKKVYNSIQDMELDHDNPGIKIGDYVVISSQDDDNAKLFEKTDENYKLIVQMALKGKSAYEVWLELGNEGTEEDFINSFKGVGIKDKEFVREDTEGNYIYRDIYSDGTKSSEYISPRGPRGYTGGVAGEPQPPGSVPYGTIIEWAGGDLPEGWLYTNGGILDKKRYPHMSFLPGTTQPQEPYFKIDGGTKLIDKGLVDNQPTWEFNFKESLGKLYQDFVRTQGYHAVYFKDFLETDGRFPYVGMTNKYYYIELPEKLSLSFMSMNKKNATGNSCSDPSTSKKNVDVYFDIEYIDENGDWIKGVELHNKTDFIPPSEVADNAIAMIKSSFKSNKFRIIINNKSTPNYITNGVSIFYVGHVVFGFDKGGAQYTDYLQIPDLKDSQGRYKIIYVGQPLAPATTEMTMFAYDNDKRQTREIPFSLAVENKIPAYVEGITLAEPYQLKLGYTNKYNKEKDSWELTKTHLDKEGYYYDVNGDLKYIPKPSICHIFDFNTRTWVFNQEEKEKALKSILEALTLKKLEKETMLELNLNLAEIDTEIENLKREIENIKNINK